MESHEEHTGKQQEQNSNGEVLQRIKDLFGETVAKAFSDEDITEQEALGELLLKESDAAIFKNLGLNFGKVVKLKSEFKSLLKQSSTSNAAKTKPSMADLASFAPETKSLYLTKRKRVGDLAAMKWRNPKFNSPEARNELQKFAEDIFDECSMPQVGFDLKGIVQHVRDFFNEQRRHKKRSGHGSCSSLDSGSPHDERKKDRLSSRKSQGSYSGESTDHESAASDTSLSTRGKKRSNVPNTPNSVEGKKRSNVPNTPNSVEGLDDSTLDMDDTQDMDYTQDINSPQDLDSSDDIDSSQDVDNGDTCVLFSQDTQSQSLLAPDSKIMISQKSAAVVIKAITSKLLGRDEMVKLLKGKFQVSAKSLTSLTVSDLKEILARKFIDKKYVEIADGADYRDLKKNQLTVQKEIEL